MTRRNRQDLAPSLFPFLAVLICTLGTLILLLALLVQDSADLAEQKVREELTQETVVIDSDSEQLTQSQAIALIDEAEFRIDAIESIRTQQAALLEERRDQLTHLEDHIGRVKKGLDRLSTEIRLASADTQTKAIDSAVLASIRDQINKEELAVEQLREETGNKTPRVVIVPHKGPNGTTRRPIYIECTPEGLTIWPEEVKIATDQLVNRPARLANPLDAALRVARLHIMKVYGDTDPPYPLLVVRPHGTDAYFRATAAMNDWDDQYGYEMLDDGIELAFNSPDPNLKRRMEESIRKALRRQADRPTPRAVPLSASQLSRDGRSRGFGQRRGHGYPGRPDGGPGGAGAIAQQANRLNDIYREAAQELRIRDGQGELHDVAGESTASSRPGTNSRSGDHAQPENDAQPGSYDPSDSQTAGPSDSQTAGSSGSQTAGPSGSQTAGEIGKQAGNPDSARSRSGATSSDQQPTTMNTANATSNSAYTMGNSAIGSTQRSDSRSQNASSKNGKSNSSKSNPVHRDGNNWALPSNVANATGIAIVRSIRVQYYEDRFVVPASRSESAQVIPIGGDLDQASLTLATVLRDRIARWGAALDNGRWEPRLELETTDNTKARFGQLKQLLDGSGIKVYQRPVQ